MPAPVASASHDRSGAQSRYGRADSYGERDVLLRTDRRRDADSGWRNCFPERGVAERHLEDHQLSSLDNLNEPVQKFLPTDRPLDVMDAAVLSGVSTVEWIESMERAGTYRRMTAGDAKEDAYLVSTVPGMRAQGSPPFSSMNKLSEYIRLAASGETVFEEDCIGWV
jgi:hypothetical protein